MTKRLCVRLDADTPVCCNEGLRNVMRLAATRDFPFTAFINPGRSIDRLQLLRRASTRRNPDGQAEKLQSTRKLGWRNTLKLLATNPSNFPQARATLHEAFRQGHDLGLHGGRNHGSWQHRAEQWSLDRITFELEWGKQAFHEADLPAPRSFASPGWNSPPGLPTALAQSGLTLLADLHGHGLDFISTDETGTILVRTALTGEPGGIGYLEHAVASGLNRAQRLERYSRDLERAGSRAIMYDHPFFAGREGLPLLEEFVLHARQQGWHLVTVREFVDDLPVSSQ